ncbi:MAG: gliding motility-associated C-terminal domain-containing protein, partial [Cyclobacteriaceae bacterium]|nr:gliding motility-associated C-terminal domain-containing protein [Cyclobacteriaceae bacterium]
LPTVTASAQPDICTGEQINIALTPDIPGAICTWTTSAPAGVTGASNGAGNLIFQTLFNNNTAPATVTYTITPKSNGCNGMPLVVTVKVNPKPAVTGVPSTVVVCHGNTLNVPINGPVAGTVYTWTVDDPSNLGVAATGSGNLINEVLTNTTGSMATLTYTITPTGPAPTGCVGPDKVMIVTVSPQINAQFLNDDTWLCKGTKDFLQIQLDGQSPFSFSYNEGATALSVTKAGLFKSIAIQPAATTTYQLLTVTDGLGCTFTPSGPTSDVTFTVGETEASFTVAQLESCSPFTAEFTYNEVAGTVYKWNWADGTTDSIMALVSTPNKVITHTFTNTSPTRKLSPKVSLETSLPAPFPGCTKTKLQTLTVYPTIITNVFPDKTDMCSGETVKFTNQSFGVSTHRWFYRVKGTTSEQEVKTTSSVNYVLTNNTTTNPLVYEVVYQSNNANNCPAPDVITEITVYRGITAAFNEGTVPPFISGSAVVTYTNTSTPVDGNDFSYTWDFGVDASPATTTGVGPFTVTYSTPGTKELILTAVNLAADAAGLTCESQFNKTILIDLLPLVAEFKATPLKTCYPSNIQVTENKSTGDLFEWKVVDDKGGVTATSTALLPEFQIPASGHYTIFLKTISSFTGQFASTQMEADIFDKPLSTFDIRPDVVFVPDTELSTFNYSEGATGYIWDFGDGGNSTDFEPKYTYKVEGIYNVSLIAYNDHGDNVVCSDTLSRKITAKQGGITKVPNAFTPGLTPNGGTSPNSSFNDVFLPMVRGVEEFNMQIFDRWGNLIFESNNANVGWDGFDRHGKALPSSVYVYKLTLRLSDGQRTTQVGDITLIR